MATLRNRRKLAAVSRAAQEYPRNSQSQNSSAPGITEDFLAHVSEESEGRVTKKISQEISRTEYRILDALFKLDQLLLNPQVRTFCGTLKPKNQVYSRDRSQNDPHPEVVFSASRASNLIDSNPDETSHRVTGDREEISYCSPGTSSGKQK